MHVLAIEVRSEGKMRANNRVSVRGRDLSTAGVPMIISSIAADFTARRSEPRSPRSVIIT